MTDVQDPYIEGRAVPNEEDRDNVELQPVDNTATLRVLYHVVHSYQSWRAAGLPNELTDDAIRIGEQHLRENNWWPNDG